MINRDNLTVKKCAGCNKFLSGPFIHEFWMQVHHWMNHHGQPEEPEDVEDKEKPRARPMRALYALPVVMVHRHRPLQYKQGYEGGRDASSARQFFIAPEKSTDPIETEAFEALDCPDEAIPSFFKCPVSHELMKEPLILSDGHSYDEETIRRMVQESEGPICSPLSSKPVMAVAIRNLELKEAIRRFVYEQVKLYPRR
jgi:hypothetical protein